MKDAIINLVWVWAQATESEITKESIYGQGASPIICIQTLKNDTTLCDISFSLVDRRDLMDLLALATETNLQVDSCITVSRLGIIRLYFLKSNIPDNGIN